MEPPRPDVPAGRQAVVAVSGDALRVAAVAATAALAVTATGDVFALATLLGLLAADVVTWGTATLLAVGVFARFGTSSLRAVSGAQSVLGMAGVLGPARLAVACWLLAAAAVLLSPPGLPALAFGATGALLVAGPGPSAGVAALAIRAGGLVLGVGGALAVGRWVPERLARWGAVACAVVGVVLVLPGGLA